MHKTLYCTKIYQLKMFNNFPFEFVMLISVIFVQTTGGCVVFIIIFNPVDELSVFFFFLKLCLQRTQTYISKF